MSELQQIIPRPGQIRPEKPYRTPDRRWEEVCDEIYGSHALPENLQFESDPQWDQRFWSIQNAHDQAGFATAMMPGVPFDGKRRRYRFGFWSVIGLLMASGDLGWLWFRVR